MRDVLAMVLAGGKAETLLSLSRVRAKASVPVAGNYRLIDFTLSNCVHSGINHVGILTQYLPLSLKAHIGVGRPWDLDRRAGGVRLLEPYYAGGEHQWYRGTGDALAQNLEIIDDNLFDHVLVVAGEHVYRMDYRPLLDFHRAAGADITVTVKAVPPERARRCGVVQLARGNAVVGFDEKPAIPKSQYASIAVYVFDRRFLVRKLRAMVARGGSDIVYDVIIPAIGSAPVFGYLFYDYWSRIETVDEYFDVNFELAAGAPALPLDDPIWPVYTTQHDDPAVKVGPQAAVINSLVADGCIINGHVENAVLFRRVYVEAGARVTDAILLDHARVDEGATVNRAVVDKRVVVGRDAVVGADAGENRPNAQFPEQLASGLTLVGKGARIPDHFVVGRNCLVDINAGRRDFDRFPDGVMPTGTSVLAPDG